VFVRYLWDSTTIYKVHPCRGTRIDYRSIQLLFALLVSISVHETTCLRLRAGTTNNTYAQLSGVQIYFRTVFRSAVSHGNPCAPRSRRRTSIVARQRHHAGRTGKNKNALTDVTWRETSDDGQPRYDRVNLLHFLPVTTLEIHLCTRVRTFTRHDPLGHAPSSLRSCRMSSGHVKALRAVGVMSVYSSNSFRDNIRRFTVIRNVPATKQWTRRNIKTYGEKKLNDREFISLTDDDVKLKCSSSLGTSDLPRVRNKTGIEIVSR